MQQSPSVNNVVKCKPEKENFPPKDQALSTEKQKSNNKSLYDIEKKGLGSRSFQKALKNPPYWCRRVAHLKRTGPTTRRRHVGYQGTIKKTQLSRQIIPRTKNGHAPPITQSWKD